MITIKFCLSNGFVGCDETVVQSFDTYDEELFNNVLEDLVYCNAENYEYMATGWDDDFSTDEEREAYYENAFEESYWEIVEND